MEKLADALSRVRLVIVEPTYDGNLGKVARAMRNFGLGRLVLVGGNADPGSEESRWYARAEGEPVLDAARRADTLDEALAGCRMVIGTTRRTGRKRGSPADPDTVFEETAPWRSGWETAIVFGREAHGLSTEEIDRCQRLISIPTDDACPSMNLSHAVAVTAYALATAARRDRGDAPRPIAHEPAPAEDVEAMFSHARRVWTRIGYLHHQNPDAILRRWRQILGRALLTEYDVRVIRALVHQVDWVAGVARLPPGGPKDGPPGLIDKHRHRDTDADGLPLADGVRGGAAEGRD